MTSPLSILHESIKAVPAVKYALGLAGLASVIAIVRSLNLDFRVAVFGAVVMLLLMVSLVIFARLSSLASPDFRLPALVFTWFSLFLLIAIALSMFLSVFFRWPIDLQNWIKPPDPSYGRIQNPIADSESRKNASQSDKLENSQGMEGPRTGLTDSKILNAECPEIAFADYSKYPVEYRKERRCIP
ncbi:MAG: hypothetical protein JSS31_10550 [Proteobacteria bacterium]|nr:hypothetical protein [Pseudomonadota bacterium]MBS0494372.1 hypothetical protein [Pseudomonadota bacterium]